MHPHSAKEAKQSLHNMNIDGRPLHVTQYEVKEISEIEQQNMRDKRDWDQYQNPSGFVPPNSEMKDQYEQMYMLM